VKKVVPLALLFLLIVTTWLVFEWARFQSVGENARQKRETLVIISSVPEFSNRLFKAGKDLSDVAPIELSESKIWLLPGNYFLESTQEGRKLFFPIPLREFPQAPDKGSFVVTVRNSGAIQPPRVIDNLTDYVFIPSGSFLLGDRLNPREPHYIWLTGFFVGRYEVTNAEFREFLLDRDGYSNDTHWTAEGVKWKSNNRSNTSALLKPKDRDFQRFGRDDLPATWVNWYEANAYCNWLTRKLGGGRWLFTLPTEAEWEKAARGPDSFDYGLGITIGDAEADLYNWRKNPDAPVPVAGIRQTQLHYLPNRYGLYHVSGNVTEWTQSVNVPYSQLQPYRDDERNHDDTRGLRVARGGSWYSASTAYLYIPYRDAFQPEHSTQEIGFRIVARQLP